jgi:hypothetical protein
MTIDLIRAFTLVFAGYAKPIRQRLMGFASAQPILHARLSQRAFDAGAQISLFGK